MIKLRISFLMSLLLLASLNINAQPNLVGVCSEGGNQFGAIMKYVAGDTVLTDVYKLPGTVGVTPQYTSCVDVNGKVYGMTSEGGAYDGGIIYEYDYTTGTYLKKIDLDPSTGAYGTGAMVPGNNGNLYGVTYTSLLNSSGVIFKYDYTNNIYEMLFEFDGINGRAPAGSMLLASNNKLYGMTVTGGNNGGNGVIFEYDHINDIYTKKHDFSGSDGSYPYGALIEAPNGKLYGMTSYGGLNNLGVIFEYDIVSDTLIKKIDLDSTNGGHPYGSFNMASNGKMYAMTSEGGVSNGGVLFEYDYLNNIYTKKIDFGFNGHARGSLIEVSNGILYGMTMYGGIFEYDINTNTLTFKVSLTQSSGYSPYGSLIKASNGLLYGSTAQSLFRGVFFEYDFINNTYNKLAEFSKAEAIMPTAAPVQAPNGKFYGLTSYGGLNDYGGGVIYEYNYVSNTFNKKFDLTGTVFHSPKGGFLLASNGKFYGANITGTIFEYDYISNTCTAKANFGGTGSLGAQPNGSMIEATNGKFYGLTHYGGNSDRGVIFEFDPLNNVITKKFDFDSTNGVWPFGGLIQASNGKLYGMTHYGGSTYVAGGSWGQGILFEYDYISNTFIKRVDFSNSIGYSPNGSLMQASNGKLYGVCDGGGSNNQGVIFEFDPVTNIYSVKLNMQTLNGGSGYPTGTFFEASNGKLYGISYGGGETGRGTIFEYDINTNTYSKMVDLIAPATGYSPQDALAEFHCLPPVISASGPIAFCQGGSVTLVADVDSTSNIQWNRNGIAIPGATNTSLLVTTVGTYTVTVSNSLCPPLTSSFIRVRIPCITPFDEGEKNTGSISNNQFSFDAFYDPTSENLNLSASNVNGSNFTVVVFDQAGKLILNEKGNLTNGNFSTQLDFSPYANGIYVVRFTTEQEQSVQKIWK